MTIEEKAKAYDEALERAKAYHRNELAGSRKEMMEYIFPELRESDDERTRNEIIAFIEQAIHRGGGTPIPKEKEDKWLAYLEKQKEQKSIESAATEVTKDKDSAIKFLKSAGIMDDNGELAEMYRSEQKPADYDHEMWKNCEANFEGGKKEVIEHPERYGLQKHAEWSKKDKTMLNNLIWAIHMKSISPLDEMDDRGKYERYEKFLTSLPGRFGLKPEREWSEEDERLLTKLMTFVDIECFDRECNGQDVIDWLKSLRPNKQD